MIQSPRSHKSQSFLREAKYAVFILDQEEKENYFSQHIKKLLEKRKNGNRFTGETSVKQQLLAALSQLGEVKTANIWARKLLVEKSAIDSLRAEIDSALRQENIFGVIEIHLQDAEINSSHIQFVGIKAHRAEEIIAEILLQNRYEDSFLSAIGRDIKPKYEPKDSLQELVQESLEEKNEYTHKNPLSEIKKIKNILTKNLKKIFSNTKLGNSKNKKKRLFSNLSNDEILSLLRRRR
ncbi:hypothetical protein CCZ01_09535 [Helicobacter monodelphidis]|uniref:hypothetical protein n=1 Tax=Helicobacter sp. 15-1451 TaxID=2004995 RepID=UPI000DCC57AF|nr:hypothetical protein [Helicobacter sp. 15-1451]RAX56431.1 hypothetical protein CCZ01_09535 [Helicobacter sp. 15-1451]